jgi:rubrerythrin
MTALRNTSMSKIFYLSELLKFAIERETESFDLYTHMAEETKNAELKGLFRTLAEQETKHKMFYTAMLTHTPKEFTPKANPQDDEYMNYVKGLIDSKRTAKPISSEQLQDPIQALNYAIAREHDAVLFYTGLKQYVPKESHHKVDEIIHEEMRHASILTAVKEKFENGYISFTGN